MISKQYFMSAEDIAKFKEIKVSSLYKDYINTIVKSPILINIANEHIKNIDITDDVDELLSAKGNSAKKLNELFKDTLRNLAINIVADSIIIKDIVDVSFEDAKEDMENNFKLTYLMGLADVEHYERAEKIIEENPDTSSLIYVGYMEYKKREKNGQFKDLDITSVVPTPKKNDTEKKKAKTTPKKRPVDISSNDIEF